MKNIFKFLPVIIMGLAMASCVKDIETPDRGVQGNPEKDVQGAYTGVWTLEYTENTTTTSYQCDGTLTIVPKDEQAYAGLITVKANFANNLGMSIDLTSAVNISPLTNAGSYQMYNSVTPNGFTKKLKNIDGTLVTEEVKDDQGNTKLDDDGNPIMKDIDLSATIMGQIFPLNASGEHVTSDPTKLNAVLDFTYTYQKTILVNNRPRKLDCKEVYHFDGTCNK